jgi:hypothetical protein
MASQFVEGQPRVGGDERQDKRMVEVAGAGATTEAIGAAAAIVLAIIGLAGGLTDAMMAVATIILGAAVIMDAGAVGSRYERLMRDAWAGDERLLRVELGGGLSAGAIAGIAGIVLGILALLGMTPVSLCAVALIAFGAALLFGSAAKGRLASLGASHFGLPEGARRVVDEALSVSAGGEVLVGIGAAILGILALLGVEPVTLVLIGFLAVGSALLLGGSALGARLFGMLRHAR